MANPNVISYLPANGSQSLPLNQTSGIWVQFDAVLSTDVKEVLEDSFFLEGPDTDQYIGPGLLELKSPENISQGNLDDFLKSPGLQGIVQGSFDFKTVSGSIGVPPVAYTGTRMYFNPSHPLVPLKDYVANLTGNLTLTGSPVEHIVWKFQTGTGSIQQLPSSLSTSELADAIAHGYVAAPGGVKKLSVVRTHPEDHSVENNLQLEAIVVEFDNLLDPTSVTPESVYVETLPVTDHPSAPQFAQGEIMTQLEVSGYQLKIRLL